MDAILASTLRAIADAMLKIPPGNFFYRTSLSCRKTRTSMCFALRVFPADSAATAQWGYKSGKATAKAKATAKTKTKKPLSNPLP